MVLNATLTPIFQLYRGGNQGTRRKPSTRNENLNPLNIVLYYMTYRTSIVKTKDTNLNPAHGKVYSIQLYVMKFVSDFWRVDGFPLKTLVLL
jgi:hypothetical protein